MHAVRVVKSEYPSTTTGGWGANSVTAGTQGGWQWHITFVKNPGVYDDHEGGTDSRLDIDKIAGEAFV